MAYPLVGSKKFVQIDRVGSNFELSTRFGWTMVEVAGLERL